MDKSKAFALLLTTIMIVGIASPLAASAFTTPSGETVTIYPTFRMVLLTPVPNPTRQQWSQLVTNNLQDLGIQAQRDVEDWGVIYDRALIPDVSVLGKTYDQGGFDGLFVGYSVSPIANPEALFGGDQFAPDGQNYYLWNDSYNNALCTNITLTPDFNQRMALLKTWQAYEYQQTPDITLYYGKEIVVTDLKVDPAPFVIYHYPLWCPVEQWKYLSPSSGTTMVLAQTGPCPKVSLSPAHSTSYYDLTGYGPIFGEGGGAGCLIWNSSFANFLPYLCTSYTHSADYLNWSFKIRSGVTFQDGETLDGRDFVATVRAYITPGWKSPVYSYYAAILGKDSQGYGNNSVWYSGETGTRGASWGLDYYNVSFRLPKVWAFADADLGGLIWYPGSLLANTTAGGAWTGSWQVTLNTATLAGFKSTSFSTGLNVPYVYYAKNGTLCTMTGPYGYGPYKFGGRDVTAKTLTLYRWDGYFNETKLLAHGLASITTFVIQTIADATSAIAAVKTGAVNVLDSQYTLTGSLSLLDPSFCTYVQYLAWGLQEFGFNMEHPIFGTGTGTPLGQLDPSQAAEAARHVRTAIDYLIPKNYIIKTLIGGFGSFGVTTGVLPQMHGGNAWNSAITIRNVTDPTLAKEMAMQEFRLAGYDFIPVVPPSFWDTYGLLLSVVELAVVVVLAGFILYRLRAPVK